MIQNKFGIKKTKLVPISITLEYPDFFSGQCIGLILADSSEIAHQAVDLVKITYKNKQPLITNIQDGIKSPDRVIKDFPEFFGYAPKAVQLGDPKEKDRDDLIKIEGEFELGM